MKEIYAFEVGPAEQNLLSATGSVLSASKTADRPKISRKLRFCRYLPPAIFQMLQLSLNLIFLTQGSFFAIYGCHIYHFLGLAILGAFLSKNPFLSTKFSEQNLCLSLQSSLSLALLCIEVEKHFQFAQTYFIKVAYLWAEVPWSLI